MAIKVKQSTIDEIKKMGMTKALASAKTRRSPEFQEALKRMYGQRRLDAAMKGAQGGSMPRETYMYKGTSTGASATKRKQMVGRNTPGAPAGTGARQVASRKKPTGRAGALAAAAGAAGIAGRAKYKSTQGKFQALKAEEAKINKMKPGKARTAALKAYNEARVQFMSRNQAVQKFAQSKGGKAVGKTARALTGAAARRTAVGLAALTAYEKAKQAKAEANKAGRKVQAAGSGRAAAIKKSRGK
jgi:hypothetical protein